LLPPNGGRERPFALVVNVLTFPKTFQHVGGCPQDRFQKNVLDKLNQISINGIRLNSRILLARDNLAACDRYRDGAL
jgi:hypothetical protein